LDIVLVTAANHIGTANKRKETVEESEIGEPLREELPLLSYASLAMACFVPALGTSAAASRRWRCLTAGR
jgi:hypothetical protein